MFKYRRCDTDLPSDDAEKTFKNKADAGAGFTTLFFRWPEFQIIKGMHFLVMTRMGNAIKLGAGDQIKRNHPKEKLDNNS